jgi:type I restriction enzyme S subunit
MVNYAFQPDDTPITLPDESEKLSTKIKLSEVMEGGGRLEASAFRLSGNEADKQN